LDLRIDSLRSIIGNDGGVGIVLVIGDGLCNCTRFINLSLLDLVDDRIGGVF